MFRRAAVMPAGGVAGAPSNDLKAIWALPSVGRILSTAATARIINYRMQERLLDIRARAIASGVDKVNMCTFRRG